MALVGVSLPESIEPNQTFHLTVSIDPSEVNEQVLQVSHSPTFAPLEYTSQVSVAPTGDSVTFGIWSGEGSELGTISFSVGLNDGETTWYYEDVAQALWIDDGAQALWIDDQAGGGQGGSLGGGLSGGPPP
jgi:hypothetical protein